jgi:hypothetical protein
MKRPGSIVILLLTVCTLFVASADPGIAGQSVYSSGGDGVLRMKHSPVLGINIPIAVWIDGKQAGAFAKGHVYERYLSPGRHDVYASRPGQLSDSWFGTLDVRSGETYSFVVKVTPNRVLLLPVSEVH